MAVDAIVSWAMAAACLPLCSRVRMLCRRSQILTRMTRTSLAIARIALRKFSAWALPWCGTRASIFVDPIDHVGDVLAELLGEFLMVEAIPVSWSRPTAMVSTSMRRLARMLPLRWDG